jgi:hypothetical protein
MTAPEIKTPGSQRTRPASGKDLCLLLGSGSTGAELNTKLSVDPTQNLLLHP